MSLLYEYMNSHEFQERIGAIKDAVDELQDILNKERTWHTTKWNQQESQLHEIVGLSVEITDTVTRILTKGTDKTKVIKLPAHAS